MTGKGKHLFSYLMTTILTLLVATTMLGQSTPYEVVDETGKTHTFKDSAKVQDFLIKQLEILKFKGYILASTDTISGRVLRINPGAQFRLENIRVRDDDLDLLAAVGLYPTELDQPLSQRRLEGVYQRITTYLENNGYPYSTIRLDSIRIDSLSVSGILAIDKGSLVRVDALIIDSRLKTDLNYLYKYLAVEPGSPFNLKKIEDMDNKIDQLSFLKMNGATSVTVYNNLAEINLPLKEEAVSRFDFLIGIQPSTVDGDQSYNLIGEFTGEILNLLGRGEYFFAQLRRFSVENQELRLNAKYPYVLNTNIGVTGAFNLFRNGSRFLELKSSIGGFLQLEKSLTGSLTLDYTSSRLIEIDSAYIFANVALPPDLDVRKTGVTTGLEMNRLDYIVNPRKGFHIGVDIGISQKTVIENTSIQNLVVSNQSFANSYDTLDLTSVQWTGRLMAAYYQPVGSFAALKLGVNGEIILNSQGVYRNEYYRIGGNKRLRGFDEISITTDKYLIATAEFRFLLDRNSFLTLPFIDYGWTHLTIDDEPRWDRAIGAGMGINFSTNIGMFNVSFAVGSRLGNPVNLNNTKVHLGYISLF